MKKIRKYLDRIVFVLMILFVFVLYRLDMISDIVLNFYLIVIMALVAYRANSKLKERVKKLERKSGLNE